MSKKATPQTPTFSRPPFFHELTEDAQKKFNELPGWTRHLVKRLIDHGDLSRAAQETGVARYVNENVDAERAGQVSLIDALNKGGMTPDVLVAHLMECLEAKMIQFDKHRNVIHTVNLSLKLKTLELIFGLRGDLQKKKSVDESPKGTELFEDTPI